MESNVFTIRPLEHHIEEISSTLVGYWAQDLWDVRECSLFTGVWKQNGRRLFWENYNNLHLRKEMKFYVAYKLEEKTYSLYTIFQNSGAYIHRFGAFIDKQFPNIKSIIDVPKHKLIFMWRNFLEELNLQTVATKKSWTIVKQKLGSDAYYTLPSGSITFISQFYEFILDFYDDRSEVEKNIWDVRKLGLKHNLTKLDYKLDFTVIPSPFVQLVKKYTHLLLIKQESVVFSTMTAKLVGIAKFLNFINETHPEWNNLNQLSRNDIELFLHNLRVIPAGGRSRNKTLHSPISDNTLIKQVGAVKMFIFHLQQYEWIEAPSIPVQKLVFFEDTPKPNKKVSDEISYIPDEVWEQVLININKLPQEYIPIILVMEASGFRCCDVLMLKIDCLLESDNGWWLVGDQQKVKYKDHKVPISEEIASIILAQQKMIEQAFKDQSGPQKYLFPTLKGPRRGLPVSQRTVSQNLNQLSKKCIIQDRKGNMYWFKNHAFRHRYGVTLINNGMDITIVQQLMAHTSPEMTAVYAKIFNETKRKEWERARSLGAFPSIRLSTDGQVIQGNLEEQAQENGLELEWIRHNFDSIRLDHGFCIKSPKAPCDFLKQTIEPPCIKNNCKSFHVDQTFQSYYKDQVAKMENDITIYQKAGRARSIELTEVKLERYKKILNELENNNGIFGLPKDRREYNGQERESILQHG